MRSNQVAERPRSIILLLAVLLTSRRVIDILLLGRQRARSFALWNTTRRQLAHGRLERRGQFGQRAKSRQALGRVSVVLGRRRQRWKLGSSQAGAAYAVSCAFGDLFAALGLAVAGRARGSLLLVWVGLLGLLVLALVSVLVVLSLLVLLVVVVVPDLGLLMLRLTRPSNV